MKNLNLNSGIIFLSMALLASACAPNKFSSLESSSVQQIASTPGPVEVTPSKSSVPLIEHVPLGDSVVNASSCVDVTQDPFAFDIVANNGKIASLQVTQLPTTAKNTVDYNSYSVYALMQGDDGVVRAYPGHSEVTVDGTRLYGHYNCLIQTSSISDLAESKGIKYSSAAPSTQVHVLVPESNSKLVGFAVRNQENDQVTMRCIK